MFIIYAIKKASLYVSVQRVLYSCFSVRQSGQLLPSHIPRFCAGDDNSLCNCLICHWIKRVARQLLSFFFG